MAEKKRKTETRKAAPKKEDLPRGATFILDNGKKHGYMAMFYPDGQPRVCGPYRKTRKEAEKDLDAMSSGYETRPR